MHLLLNVEALTQAYNFLGSWQLFPEKGFYEWGERPKSGIYKIEAIADKQSLKIHHSWITLENQGFASEYTTTGSQPEIATVSTDPIQLTFISNLQFELNFHTNNEKVLTIFHELLPNGYLKISKQGKRTDGTTYTDTEVYHKQLSVLPYAASASGALIKPTEEGVIRNKALAAMEEQTNMQLEQIRKQVELLAQQAQAIHQRKELAQQIYSAKLSFKPEIGQIYYLYEKADNTHTLSLIGPQEWGRALPYKNFIAAVQLLADHTWKEV